MVGEVTPDEVKAKLDDGTTQIIDIRQPKEFEHAHIPGAINVPMTDLPKRIDEIEWSDDVTVVCPIGESSVQAARLIGSYEGADADAVKSMKGGYDEWEYELETGAADSPSSQ
jgi:rhodanese-related sulfurtransferase